MLGYGVWAVEEKAGGGYIGSMGFINARRGMNLPFDDAPEAAWLIAPDRQGQGLAGEGLGAVFAWADTHLDQTWCMINTPNTISQKVAARLGYRRVGEGNYRGKTIPTYLRPRGGGA
jgi:RimJ/RimL family protein N-acetyltransferase